MENIISYLKTGAVAFDFATTDINPASAGIIEVAAGNRTSGYQSMLFNPGYDIPATASAVNGISNAMVADAPMFADRIPEVLELLGGFRAESPALVAHYAQYEIDAIKATAARTGSPELQAVAELGNAPFLCTLRLARNVMRAEAPTLKYGLAELRYAFDVNVEPHVQPGRAGDSAAVTWALFEFLVATAVERGLLDPASDNVAADVHALCWGQPRAGSAVFDKWPFKGKNQGVPIKAIKTDDLLWFSENIDALQEGHASFDPDLFEAVRAELEVRVSNMGDDE